MRIKKKRLEVIIYNLLDVLYDEIMCNETYFNTLKNEIGLSYEEIKELDSDIYQRIVIELGANIWN